MRKCKIQISTQTDNQNKKKKKVATNGNRILRQMGLKFQNPNYNILCKAAFWNKQTLLNKELITWSRLPK